MVRAAGLYPAGSRFESWLPYHPVSRSAATRDPGRLRRATKGALDTPVRAARGSVRRSRRADRRVAADERRVDLEHVVPLRAAEPALHPLGVAGNPLQRVLHVDPAAAGA